MSKKVIELSIKNWDDFKEKIAKNEVKFDEVFLVSNKAKDRFKVLGCKNDLLGCLLTEMADVEGEFRDAEEWLDWNDPDGYFNFPDDEDNEDEEYDDDEE